MMNKTRKIEVTDHQLTMLQMALKLSIDELQAQIKVEVASPIGGADHVQYLEFLQSEIDQQKELLARLEKEI